MRRDRIVDHYEIDVKSAEMGIGKAVHGSNSMFGVLLSMFTLKV